MKVVINDQLIEYSIVGSGPNVFMLHGWGQDMQCFNDICTSLSKKYTVIRFDFPGFGGSSIPKIDWSIDDYANITKSFLEKIKVDKLYAVIGHSFGGRVIFKGFDILKPQKVILIGSAGIKPKPSNQKILLKMIAKTGKIFTNLPLINKHQSKIKQKFYKKIGSSDYINSNQLKGTFLNVINKDLTEYISKIDVPTLLIWGDNDNETPVNDAIKMNEMIKNSQLITYPGAGHFVFQERSVQVIKNIEDFLND